MSTILITGAARGIGAETAKRLAGRGHKLALLGLEPELLEEVAAECNPTHPAATAYEVDVCDRDAPDETIERAVAQLGGLDVAIAHAVTERGAAASEPVGAGGAASIR